MTTFVLNDNAVIQMPERSSFGKRERDELTPFFYLGRFGDGVTIRTVETDRD